MGDKFAISWVLMRLQLILIEVAALSLGSRGGRDDWFNTGMVLGVAKVRGRQEQS